MEPRGLGEALIQQGWDQGSLLTARPAQQSWLARRPVSSDDTTEASGSGPELWETHQQVLAPGEHLVVSSQACDIARDPTKEPFVELLRASWTDDKQLINEAGRNSIRRFLLRRRTGDDGVPEGLIADATSRIYVEKSSLLGLTPEPGLDPSDQFVAHKFRRWLADRYNRPAVPDNLVAGVQKHVVEAVRKLKATDDLTELLTGVDQILFFADVAQEPYEVELILMRNERQDVSLELDEEGAARIAGWLSEVIREGAMAKVVHWEILDSRTISLYDYVTAYPLPLDYYTLRGEPDAIAETPFVREI